MDESSYKAPQYVNFRLMNEDRSSDENEANGYFSASETSYNDDMVNGDDEMYNTVISAINDNLSLCSATKKKKKSHNQSQSEVFKTPLKTPRRNINYQKEAVLSAMRKTPGKTPGSHVHNNESIVKHSTPRSQKVPVMGNLSDDSPSTPNSSRSDTPPTMIEGGEEGLVTPEKKGKTSSMTPRALRALSRNLAKENPTTPTKTPTKTPKKIAEVANDLKKLTMEGVNDDVQSDIENVPPVEENIQITQKPQSAAKDTSEPAEIPVEELKAVSAEDANDSKEWEEVPQSDESAHPKSKIVTVFGARRASGIGVVSSAHPTQNRRRSLSQAKRVTKIPTAPLTRSTKMGLRAPASVPSRATVSRMPYAKPAPTKPISPKLTAPRFTSKPTSKVSPYMSMAEACRKFQNATPLRFKASNKGPVEAVKSMKLTHAVSPKLMSKHRSRPLHLPSRAEREEQELEEMRKHQIKANPIKPHTLKPLPPKRVERKPVTVPEPFALTEVHKSAVPQAPSSLKKPKKPRMIVGVGKDGKTMEMMPVLHYGIKFELKEKSSTKCMPFSFDSRNKAIKKNNSGEPGSAPPTTRARSASTSEATGKKDNPMPRAITAPSKKRCASTSDAVKPKPRAVTATVAASARVKSGSAGDVTKPQNRSVQVQRTQSSSSLKGSVKRATSFDSKVKAGVPAPLRKEPSFTKTKIEPFSFEARDRAQREKREQKLRQQQEDERKAHNFHAKPLPKYKPVTVHTLNRENIKEKLKQQRTQQPQAKDNNKTVAKAKPIVEQSKKPVAVKPPTLHSDIRARERKEFDERIRQKELEEERLRQEAEEQQKARELAEIQEIRRQQTLKAQPIPVYKPFNVAKSNKELTVPQSPAWQQQSHN